MRVASDPARLLLRALRRSAAVAGCSVDVTHERETAWASATFVGAQHRVTVNGAELTDWLNDLPEADLPLRGHFVASCAVEHTGCGATLTLLVLEACDGV